MDLLTLIATCAPMVAPTTMKALVLEESHGHPYAIHDGQSHQALFPTTKSEAVAMARRLIAEGVRIDAGLAQINSKNWNSLGLTPETVFDPCTNLRAGERVILDGYISAPYTVDAAISRYNTGDATRGVRNGYVDRVKAWMPKSAPNRQYEAQDGPIRDGDNDGEAPMTVDASLETDHLKGEGAPTGASLTQTAEQEHQDRKKLPAWNFVPVTDGFGEGG